MIKVENASFEYDGVTVFENINLELVKGEILCLFGPNGCGKTTLIDNILGHLRLKTGTILIDGKDQQSFSRRDLAKKIAYVPQIHEKTFPYKVIEVVVMGRTPYCYGLSSPGEDDYAIAEKALETAGISHLKERIYTRLSGGETQLVILARALAQGSPVIIMDEPASHLDFRHELMLLETVAGLISSKSLSIIMSTHSPNHAFYFENKNIPARVALMNEKKIIATGIPCEIFSEERMRDVFNIDSRVISDPSATGAGNYIIPFGIIR
jgi:iron complex transport system ATP-binding protein